MKKLSWVSLVALGALQLNCAGGDGSAEDELGVDRGSESSMAPPSNDQDSIDGSLPDGSSSVGDAATGGSTFGDEALVPTGSGGEMSGTDLETIPGTGGETGMSGASCDGVLNGGGNICCAASCGECGGTGCSGRPGGAEACCATPILDSGRVCSMDSAPCAMGEDPGMGGDGDGGDPPPVGDYGELVLDVDFDNRSGGLSGYTQSMASADFGGLDVRSSGEVRGLDGGGKTWPADNRAGQGYLRANYPADIAGGTNCGFLFDKQFEGVTEATFEYRVYFEGAGSNDEFVWASGGKLPGLGGSNKASGIPVGCTTNQSNIDNGFSARLMWRKRGDLVVYTYFPDRTTSCGGDFTFLQGAQPNTWYTIREHIKLNTPGEYDGLLEMYVDGERTFRKTDILYRLSGKSNVLIDNVLFHTYRGGKPDDVRFHSPNNDHVRFDDFRVWVK